MNKKHHLWLILVLPPILFLVAIAGFSVFYGATGLTNADEIAARVTGNVPAILLAVQLLLFAVLVEILRREGQGTFDFGWQAGNGQNPIIESGAGTILGVALASAYVLVLAPMQMYLQGTMGDYVPPGSVLTALGGNAVIFFLANVVLAPFVEERLYRGFALAKLQQAYGNTAAVLSSSIFFGLLHWVGGFWYMVLTGVVIGMPFAVLALWRRNIVLTFAAHFALNLFEFLYVTFAT